MKLSIRLSIAFSLVTVFVTGLVVSGILLSTRNRLREEVRTRLRDAAALAALQIDAEAHRTLTEPEQEAGPVYGELKKTLQRIRDSGTDFRYVYTWRVRSDGRMVFVGDAESDPEKVSHLGDVYEDAGPELEVMLAGLKKPAVDKEFTIDSWGILLSGYAPFYTRDGMREGILGIDIEASQVLAYERTLLRIILGIFAISVLLAVGLGRIIGGRLAAPVAALAESASRIAEGEWSHRVGVKASGEVGMLVTAFNEMAGKIQQTLKQLKDEIAERMTAEQNLRYHQENLEQIVVLRTEAIEREMEERKKAEHLLTIAKTELEQVFNCAAPLCLIDEEFNLLRANEAFRTFFQLPKGVALGEKCFQVKPDQACHTADCPLTQVQETGERVECEVEIRLPSGKTLSYLCIATAYVNCEGDTRGAVQTFVDISERKRIEVELRRLAQRDGLTGVANRRSLDETLEKEWQTSRETGQPFAAILLDVDFFKMFNDAYGHQAGDRCLQRIAGALEANMRGGDDLVARYGGEEFMVVLPQADAETAQAVAERIRMGVADLGIPHAHSEVSDVVTVSVGVATSLVLNGDTSPEALVRLADDALYSAKSAGRNCIRVASGRRGDG